MQILGADSCYVICLDDDSQDSSIEIVDDGDDNTSTQSCDSVSQQLATNVIHDDNFNVLNGVQTHSRRQESDGEAALHHCPVINCGSSFSGRSNLNDSAFLNDSRGLRAPS